MIYLRGKFCSRYSKLGSGVFFDGRPLRGRSLRCWAYRRFVVLRPPRLRLFKCTPFGGGFRFIMLRLIIADASTTTIALSPTAMLHLIITDASTTQRKVGNTLLDMLHLIMADASATQRKVGSTLLDMLHLIIADASATQHKVGSTLLDMLHLIITDASTTDRYQRVSAWLHSPARQSPEGASPNSRGRGGRRTTNLRNTSTQHCVPGGDEYQCNRTGCR